MLAAQTLGLDDRLDLDLDHRIAVAEARYLDQSARRAALAEEVEPHVGAAVVLLDVRDEGGCAHDVVEGRAGVRETLLDVLAGLADLRAHVVLADDLP